MPELTDVQIRRMARQRVAFKMHALTYVSVNLFLVGVWLVTSARAYAAPDETHYFWPVWPILSWGLGLAMHGFFAYGPGQGMQAREEAKLRQSLGK